MFTAFPKTVNRRVKYYFFLPKVMFLCSCFQRFARKAAATPKKNPFSDDSCKIQMISLTVVVTGHLQVSCSVVVLFSEVRLLTNSSCIRSPAPTGCRFTTGRWGRNEGFEGLLQADTSKCKWKRQQFSAQGSMLLMYPNCLCRRWERLCLGCHCRACRSKLWRCGQL